MPAPPHVSPGLVAVLVLTALVGLAALQLAEGDPGPPEARPAPPLTAAAAQVSLPPLAVPHGVVRRAARQVEARRGGAPADAGGEEEIEIRWHR